MNMGGPNDLDEVKVFLKNMFNDKYIITAPQPIRAMIASIIVYKRLEIAKENYRKLGGMSPIIGHTKRLVRRLNEELDADVFYEMRYTYPFASDILEKLNLYSLRDSESITTRVSTLSQIHNYPVLSGSDLFKLAQDRFVDLEFTESWDNPSIKLPNEVINDVATFLNKVDTTNLKNYKRWLVLGDLDGKSEKVLFYVYDRNENKYYLSDDLVCFKESVS